MNNPFVQMAINLIESKNPENLNTPWGQAAMQALKSGDDKKGQEIAMNLAQSFGRTRDEAIKDAMSGFGL